MKLGGTVSYKILIAPYETMEVSSFMELEVSGENTQEEISEKQDKISQALKNDVNKKAKEFINNYHEKIKNLKKTWES
jgi:hypothetical protein